MAAFTVTVTLLLLACPMVLSAGFYSGAMSPVDKTALEAMKAAVVNKAKFPVIKCYGGTGEMSSQPFRCTDTGRLFLINFSGLNLGGKISPEVGKLTKLIYLYLTMNKLTGTIPSSIGNLTNLLFLALDMNQLSGGVPLSLGNLKVVESVLLANNQLSGGIPSSLIPKMTNIQFFTIRYNFFTGPISLVDYRLPCSQISSNCLFNSSLPKGCAPKDQKSTATCKAFCDATQLGGPCGGGGICSNVTSGPSCACNKGYSNKVNKFTCKLV